MSAPSRSDPAKNDPITEALAYAYALISNEIANKGRGPAAGYDSDPEFAARSRLRVMRRASQKLRTALKVSTGTDAPDCLEFQEPFWAVKGRDGIYRLP
jgi:hypothetical protein